MLGTLCENTIKSNCPLPRQGLKTEDLHNFSKLRILKI